MGHMEIIWICVSHKITWSAGNSMLLEQSTKYLYIYIYKSTCVVWLSNYMTKLHQILRTWEGWMHAGSGIPSQREYGIYEMGEMMISLYGWQICYMCKSSNLTYHPTLMTIYSGRIWMCDSVTLNIILPDVTFLAVRTETEKMAMLGAFQNCCHNLPPKKQA